MFPPTHRPRIRLVVSLSLGNRLKAYSSPAIISACASAAVVAPQTAESPQTADLDHLNAELSTNLGRLRVASSKKGFNWTWANADDALDQPLGPIARSAADLLTSPHLLEQVRLCEGDTCGWLFVDSTKNHSRRWCVMSDCGNVAKVRRFRMKNRRSRSARSATSRKATGVPPK